MMRKVLGKVSKKFSTRWGELVSPNLEELTTEELTLRAIDILVNNAGQGCVAPIIEVGMQRVRDTFNVSVPKKFSLSR